MTLQRWFWNLLIAVDQGANALLAGNPDETISSRAAKAQAKGKAWACLLCGLLDRLDRDHCAKSIELDEVN